MWSDMVKTKLRQGRSEEKHGRCAFPLRSCTSADKCAGKKCYLSPRILTRISVVGLTAREFEEPLEPLASLAKQHCLAS